MVGVELRDAADREAGGSLRARLARSKASLQKKARLYDELVRVANSGGDVAAAMTAAGVARKRGADHEHGRDEGEEEEGFLVDFQRKAEEAAEAGDGSGDSGGPEVGGPLGPRVPMVAQHGASGNDSVGMIDIEDEFGRTVSVRRGSREHMRWRQAQRRAEQSQDASTWVPDASDFTERRMDDVGDATQYMSDGLRVKQRWEHTLNETEKYYLEGIAAETRHHRAKAAAEKRARAVADDAQPKRDGEAQPTESAGSQRRKRADALFASLIGST